MLDTAKEVRVPDIGDFEMVDVVEVLVQPGHVVAIDDPLITLETEKASMEVPSTVSGKVREVLVKVGDQVGEGAVIAVVDAEDGSAEQPDAPAAAEQAAAPLAAPAPAREPATVATPDRSPKPHASPAVRRAARISGIDLRDIEGSGPHGRILKEDVDAFARRRSAVETQASATIDFSRFGEIEIKPLSRIRAAAARNVHRAWTSIPHVTQHDEADITELESFRKVEGQKVKEHGLRLTLLSFVMKAVVGALREYPDFNASLGADGTELILKKYFHVGIAVDTPDGLVVPVIRDVDRKSLLDLARELADVSSRARAGKMRLDEMQGGCFTISSLGGIGGTAFTPIVSAPEVAILGVSRAKLAPVYRDGAFEPRLMLPLSLSYDHRVIDGAAAARFTTHLAHLLSDVRRLLL